MIEMRTNYQTFSNVGLQLGGQSTNDQAFYDAIIDYTADENVKSLSSMLSLRSPQIITPPDEENTLMSEKNAYLYNSDHSSHLFNSFDPVFADRNGSNYSVGSIPCTRPAASPESFKFSMETQNDYTLQSYCIPLPAHPVTDSKSFHYIPPCPTAPTLPQLTNDLEAFCIPCASHPIPEAKPSYFPASSSEPSASTLSSSYPPLNFRATLSQASSHDSFTKEAAVNRTDEPSCEPEEEHEDDLADTSSLQLLFPNNITSLYSKFPCNRLSKTFFGYIDTTEDTLLLVEACIRGILPRVRRRLNERERNSIKSGTVLIFNERESGIKRWTDGKWMCDA